MINKEKKETYQQLETQHVSSPAVVVTASAATVLPPIPLPLLLLRHDY